MKTGINLNALFAELRLFEGTGPMRGNNHLMYRDSKGIWTIGFGHNLEANGIPREVAELLLRLGVANAARELDRALPWWKNLDGVRARVLLDLCFNMGIGNSKKGLLTFKNTLAALRAGDWPTVAAGLRSSKWYRDVGPRRADPLIRMMETGEEPTWKGRGRRAGLQATKWAGSAASTTKRSTRRSTKRSRSLAPARPSTRRR